MDETIKELNDRVYNLRQRLLNIKENESITTQIERLDTRLAKILKQHPEFEKLFDATIRFGISQEQIPNKVDEQESQPEDIPNDIKEERILLNYASIIKAYPQIQELEQINPMKLINSINSVISNSNIENTRTIIEQNKDQIIQINKIFHSLVLKSVLVFEKYVQFVLQYNEFWIKVEDQMKVALQDVNKLERRNNKLHKY
ncbi:hypothetical protein KGF54_002239 [Candida jiufengensis]|uniref:uncharacterized protein n=1 Tax=Candida jiufengensis TaxID=497108 RepID=UPI00222569CB|nr:uncharacterized protein KGF54_002239 [Candida jiufengensis]KAI5954464.1 hypothetical protein KGF54_002239 [Candida jiufengensis]